MKIIDAIRRLGGTRSRASATTRKAAFGRAGYEIVASPTSGNRRPFFAETKGEDGMLGDHDRNRLVAAGRDLMRNSPTRVAMDQQRRVNVVGTVGGKLYASFPDGHADAADDVMRWFNREWSPHCEFTFGKSLNWLLKTVLTAEDVGGNVILVFDDGILTGGDGTGLVRGFEADEIANVSDADFAALWPEGYTQRGGFVYDNFGRFAGAFVSTTRRGRSVFDKGTYITLRRDNGANWTALGDMRRFNQGRAVAPLSSSLATAVDLHEILSSETLAAKFNAQLVGQIIHSISEDGGDYNPYSNAGVSQSTDAADGDPEAERVKKVTLDHLRNIGIRYQDMPEGVKMELLDTKRPNANMPQFVDFLTGLIGGTRGLARVYATLKAQTSYTAFRGEQVMTWPSFEESQKELEREVCDWCARLAISRAVRKGLLTSPLPDGWEHMLAWQWPKMREVNQTDAENAFATGLRNGSVTFFDRFGPDWENRCIRQRAIEARKFQNAGLVYPGDKDQNGHPVAPDAGGSQSHATAGKPENGDTAIDTRSMPKAQGGELPSQGETNT